MKKLINDVENVLSESLRGFGAAHGDIVRVHSDPTFVTRAGSPVQGKVALVSGGGSGQRRPSRGVAGC